MKWEQATKVLFQCLQKSMQWQSCPMLVIGDDTNDLPMLQHYHGYTVDRARETIKAQASGVYTDVGAMLAAHC